jgi:hypothetical protein
MRVYGALMWSLGKILYTPEVARVYIGSFWDQPLQNELNRRLFEDEEQDLYRDIQSLPRNSALRKLNDLIKRARLAKAHAYIISFLHDEMPMMFGKDAKKSDLILNLDDIYSKLVNKYQISPGDFPELRNMKKQLVAYDFTSFSSLKPKLLEAVDKMLANDIARLMTLIPQEATDTHVKGGAFEVMDSGRSPFDYKRGQGVDAGAGDLEWIVNKKRAEYDATFKTLNPVDGKVMSTDVKAEMMKTQLPSSVLGKIYRLADVDQDGLLDADEFALMMHLISIKLDGYDLPSSLPSHLIPPLKREKVQPSSSVSEPAS